MESGLLMQFVFSFIGTLFFSMVFEVPKKQLILSGLIGAIGWTAYLEVAEISGSVVFGNFAAALVIAVLSEWLSVCRKVPVTVLFIPGVLPIVPGVAIYRMAYYLVMGDSQLAKENFLLMLTISSVIALAIFFVNAVFSQFRRRKHGLLKD